MTVCMTAFPLTFAQLIIQDAAPVLKRMHHIMLQKQGKNPENTGLVHIRHGGLHIGQAHRHSLLVQEPQHKNPIGSRLYTLTLQPVCYFLIVHKAYCSVYMGFIRFSYSKT